MSTAMSFKKGSIGLIAVVKVRGDRGGGSASCFDFGGVWPPC